MNNRDTSLNLTYRTVAEVARAEFNNGTGDSLLRKFVASNPFAASPAGKNWSDKLTSESKLALIIREAVNQIDPLWTDSSFVEAVELNSTTLLVNFETGDYPSIIQAGYPFVGAEPFPYRGLDRLAEKPYFRLDDFLQRCTRNTFDELEYFEFADLTYDQLDLVPPELEDELETIELARVILCSIAMIAGLRSLRNCKTNLLPEELWMSVSEGTTVFGALTRVTNRINV